MNLLTILLLLLNIFTKPGQDTAIKTPLSEYSEEWNDPRFLKCNTAAKVTYLTDMEKELIYILNMIRLDPKLFGSTVVKQYPDKNFLPYLNELEEYKSLLKDLAAQEPLPILIPDEKLSISAKCHAITAGQKAYVGHVRQTADCQKKKYFDAECCDYGRYTPFESLMGLLIDEGVPGVGHRYACLGTYGKIGVSIQKHNSYGRNTVLDFKW